MNSGLSDKDDATHLLRDWTPAANDKISYVVPR